VSGWLLRSALPDGTLVYLTKGLAWQELSDQAEVHDLYANAAGVVAGLHHAGVDGGARIVPAEGAERAPTCPDTVTEDGLVWGACCLPAGHEAPFHRSEGGREWKRILSTDSQVSVSDRARVEHALAGLASRVAVLRDRCADPEETRSRDLLAGLAEGMRRAVDQVGRALDPVRER
jgi:hypothetical protein